LFIIADNQVYKPEKACLESLFLIPENPYQLRGFYPILLNNRFLDLKWFILKI